jgi:hypothetical protein
MKRYIALAALLLALSLVALPALAQPAGFSIPSFTAMGGVRTSGGGGFVLRGTSGRPDAGSLRGGTYTLAGSFLPGIGEPALVVPGDATGDDRVRGDDLRVLDDAFGSRRETPDWNPRLDLSGDGLIDILDMAEVARRFGAG